MLILAVLPWPSGPGRRPRPLHRLHRMFSTAGGTPLKSKAASALCAASAAGSLPELLRLVLAEPQAVNELDELGEVRIASRLIPPHGGQFDFVWLPA